MLKKTILLLFAAAVASQGVAKGLLGTEWGAVVGVRYNGLSTDAPKTLTLSPRIGYDVGLHASLLFAGVAIQPELTYTYSTARLTMADYDKTVAVKAHDVELPLLASIRMLPVVRFNAGPVFGIVSTAKYTNAVGESLNFGGLRPTFGYTAGVSACIIGKLLIDARFTGYFGRTTNEININSGSSPTTFKTRQYSGGIRVGYIF